MDKDIQVGYSFEKVCKFTGSELREMARACGDMNFIHHDLEAAKRTRFKNLIGSGSAITGYFSALIPTHFATIAPILGLEMTQKFLAPIFPDTTLYMKWQVNKIHTKSNNDLIVELYGSITDENEVICISSTASILLVDKM